MPPDGDSTPARLQAAAVELIVELGWGGVSTRKIAERAGVRSGLVHYHFGSVDDLRREAALGALHAMLDPFLEMAATMPPRAILDAAITASVEDYAPGTDEATLMYEVLPNAGRDPQLAAGLRELLLDARRVFAEAIRSWHPQPLADPNDLAELVFAALDGLQLHLLADPDLDFTRHLAPLLILLGPEATP